MTVWRRRSRSWRNASFAVLDFETTGLDLDRDHVLSLGLVPVVDGRVRLAGSLYRVVRPPIPVPASSIRVHGIRPDELEDAPTLDTVAGDLLAALDDRLLVAHAAVIELAFLERIVRTRRARRMRRAIDVVFLAEELAERERAGAVPSPRLADLAELFGVPVLRTHHAFADALVTAQLFLVLATRLERLGAGGVRDLARAGRSPTTRRFFLGR